MKKLLGWTFAFVALAMLLSPVAMGGESGSWNGWITDDHCGAKGANADHAACAKKCVDGGGEYVFYNSADEKIYHLDNQELAAEHLGHEVVVTGAAEGDSIAVESIAAAEAG